jgi:hypothetical protein
MVCERLRFEEFRACLGGCFCIREGGGSRVRAGGDQSGFHFKRKHGKRLCIHVCARVQFYTQFRVRLYIARLDHLRQ